MSELALSRPPAPAIMRVRRSTPIGLPTETSRQHADVLVTPSGRLRIAPLVAAMGRELAPMARIETRHHAGLDIVCVVLAGALRYEPSDARGVTLATEDVAVLSTGRGVTYRWWSVGDEPARAVMFWLLGSSTGTPRIDVCRASRSERLSRAVPIAGRDTVLPTSRDVRILAGVVPVGGSFQYTMRGRRCYIVPTIGTIAADGTVIRAGDGALIDQTGAIRIAAQESTEVVIVETP